MPDHPVDRPVLPPLMLLCLLLGAGCTLTRGTANAAPIIDAIAVVAFGCFLILFAVYWAGWLLREHTRWRDQR